MQGTTGPSGTIGSRYDFLVYLSGGITATTPLLVFRIPEAMTISEIDISMLDSGAGGSGLTQFEFFKMTAGSLPALPPTGTGSASVAVGAIGAGIMNSSKVTGLAITFNTNDYLIISTSTAPAGFGNSATISIR